MWNILTFTELPSTQQLAKEKLQAGSAKHGDVLAAMHQTGGQGRYPDRIWHDEFGANLLMSVILTEIPVHLIDKMQFIAALSVLTTVRSQLSIRNPGRSNMFDTSRVRLKWTNDVLIDLKKVSGVVADAIWTGGELKGIVIGIGININQEHFPDELAETATSLKQYTRDSIPVDGTRSLVLSMLQFSLEYYTSERLTNRLREEFEWMRSLQSIDISEADGSRIEHLHYNGITDDGALIALLPDGAQKIFQTGSLHFA